jgi:tetratricopeptide (TPR) repeat protein
MRKINWIEDYLEVALRLAWEEGHETALQLLHHLLSDEPGYARLHHTLGIVYFSCAHEQKKAEQHFRLAIHFDNLLVDSYWYLGKLLANDERREDALEIYRQGMVAKKQQKCNWLVETDNPQEPKKTSVDH